MIRHPLECELCNSSSIFACDECEQTVSYACNRCNGTFDVEKSVDEQSRWWNSTRVCDRCELNKATRFVDGVQICNECEFNGAKNE